MKLQVVMLSKDTLFYIFTISMIVHVFYFVIYKKKTDNS